MAGESAGEVIKIKPSLLPFTWKGLVVLVVGLTVSIGSFMFQPPPVLPFGTGYVFTLIGLGVTALGFLMVLVGAIKRNVYTYQITESGIIIQKQLLRRTVRRIPLTSLSDVEVSQSLIGRLAGFGNIVPISKSGYGLVHGVDPTENFVAEMTNVPNPDKIANLIMSRASLMVKPSIQR
jgi:membrane protein YdbS with pleckstrin-like domain